MKDDQLKALVKYRIEQANETLKEAELLASAHSFRGAVNRGYYVMFYAVTSLLATKGLGSSRHSGVISLFDREFVKRGLIDKIQSKSLHLAFEQRQQHDYGEFVPLKPDSANTLLSDAKAFLDAITDYLKQNQFLT